MKRSGLGLFAVVLYVLFTPACGPSLPPLLASIGSYYAPSDGNRHVIVSTSDGEMHELYYTGQPTGLAGDIRLACFCNARFITALYSPDDSYQHAVVGTDSGDIFDTHYKVGQLHVTPSIANFPNMTALSGFYEPDDQTRRLIVAQADGSLHEVVYGPSVGYSITQPALTTLSGVTHVAAFYSADDNYRHAIVSTSDGNLTEVFYSRTAPVFVSQPFANFSNIVSIAAFYADNNRMRTVIVATSDGAIHEVTYRPDLGVTVNPTPLANFQYVRAVSAFYASDDQKRHVIVAGSDGKVNEIAYGPTAAATVSPALATYYAPAPYAEMIGPDLNNLDEPSLAEVGGTSPSGRVTALAGSPSQLYAMGQTGGVWGLNHGSWSLMSGSPAPAQFYHGFPLATSTSSTNDVVAGNDEGAWESTDGGYTWTQILNPSSLGSTLSSLVNSATFDDSDRLFLAIGDGVAVRPSAGAAFQHVSLGEAITAVVVSDNLVWARSASAIYWSTDHGTTWSPGSPVPSTIHIRGKELYALAATDGFAYMVATLPGDNGCGGDNALVVFNVATGAWNTQNVKSTDVVAFEQAKGNPSNGQTCDGTGGDDSADGHRFLRSIRLRDTSLANTVGERTQLLYGGGQEVWRARSQSADGTIPDWNWMVGTQGYSARDQVHADIWDAYVDPSVGGRTVWVSGDGGVYSLTVPGADYEVPSTRAWQPAMSGLHTHQIQSVTLLRTDQVHWPRLAYALGDNSAFYQDTAYFGVPEAPWTSWGSLGDGAWSAGDSSAPTFAKLVRQLGYEGFLTFGSGVQGGPVINGKSGPFVDPSSPTRFRFVPSPLQEGQFASADVVMMVDLPLVDGKGNAFPTQPGPASNGQPLLIRNRTFDVNPDINAPNAQGQGWALERPTLPRDTQGFAISGDRKTPVYYAFDFSSLYAERNGAWTQVLTNLVASSGDHRFGPVYPNPYDTTTVYALTYDQGVVVSTDGGTTFAPDATLNGLVGSAQVVNQIAFSYDDPQYVAVATETGGVFFSASHGNWVDLSSFLPTPLIPIYSVAIDCYAIYVGTFGRGLMRIVHYRAA
jgi:hypothetical protein